MRHNGIPALLAAHPSIRRVAFNGHKAKAVFESHPIHHGLIVEGPTPALTYHVLPSSSRANTQPVAAKAAEWRRVLFSQGDE